MLNSLFNAVMEKRSRQLIEQVGTWLPTTGLLLDVGSGTGHLAARLERALGVQVVSVDVADMHVVGKPPILISDGMLPFKEGTFSATLLVFMLAYPANPAGLLTEVARVTQGPIILVQSLYSGCPGYVWLRIREFLWTLVAFYLSKCIGYIPAETPFTMQAQRFYTASELQREIAIAGLRIRSRQERQVLPSHALVVAGWMLERDD